MSMTRMAMPSMGKMFPRTTTASVLAVHFILVFFVDFTRWTTAVFIGIVFLAARLVVVMSRHLDLLAGQRTADPPSSMARKIVRH